VILIPKNYPESRQNEQYLPISVSPWVDYMKTMRSMYSNKKVVKRRQEVSYNTIVFWTLIRFPHFIILKGEDFLNRLKLLIVMHLYLGGVSNETLDIDL
jgi:hypothetical protein